jgi:hypothetical protein
MPDPSGEFDAGDADRYPDEWLEAAADEFIEAEVRNTGKPLAFMRDEEFPTLIDHLRYMATIARNLTISNVAADWLGVQFNWIGGNATLTNITALDPGDPGRSVAVVENTVGRNLICMGLAPAVSGGFIPGEVNHVGHNAIGQCAALV